VSETSNGARFALRCRPGPRNGPGGILAQVKVRVRIHGARLYQTPTRSSVERRAFPTLHRPWRRGRLGTMAHMSRSHTTSTGNLQRRTPSPQCRSLATRGTMRSAHPPLRPRPLRASATAPRRIPGSSHDASVGPEDYFHRASFALIGSFVCPSRSKHRRCCWASTMRTISKG